MADGKSRYLTSPVQRRTVRKSAEEADMTARKGAEEARNRLPELLEAAERGRATIITKRGRPVAVLAPIAVYGAAVRQRALTPVAGSGKGLWGTESARTLRKLRDEWNR
jgi:prevent-host-death family protein